MTKKDKRRIFSDIFEKITDSEQLTHSECIDFAKEIYKKSRRGYFNVLSNTLEFKQVFLDFKKHTSFLDGKYDLTDSARLFFYFNKLMSTLSCGTCGKEIIRSIVPLESVEIIDSVFCCRDCLAKSKDVQKKIRESKQKNHTTSADLSERQKQKCREKHGCDSYFQTDEFKQKSKATMLKNGYDHPMHSSEIVEKMKETLFSSEKARKKAQASSKKHLGVEFPFQSAEIRSKAHKKSAEAKQKKFFDKVLKADEKVEPLFRFEEYLEHAHDAQHQFRWKCKKCGEEFSQRIIWGNSEKAVCLSCYPHSFSTSAFEKEIAEFIESLGDLEVINHVLENRQVIPPQEIDIIVKDKKTHEIKLLIEADGLYWHSDKAGKGPEYHIAKTEACEKLGFQLVHVFEDEWSQKKEIVKSRLKSMLGKNDVKLFARKCQIAEVSLKESKAFQQENHIQGNAAAKVHLGLFHDGQLVSLMTFGHLRSIYKHDSSSERWELVRFCNKIGHQVVGAAGKLLKHFEKNWNPKQILSFADRRWSRGKVYEALGFKLDHIAKPSYWYVDPIEKKTRLYRFMFRKSKQKELLKEFDPSKTEVQNMVDNGFWMVWDCGNLAYVKDI